MPEQPLTGSFRRDPHAALSQNPVGLVPLAWPRPPDLAEIRRVGYEGIQVDGGDPAGWPPALAAEGLRPAEVYLALAGDEDGPSPAAADAVGERVAYAVARSNHIAAALMIAEGVHLLAVKERRGHSTIQITGDRYGHLFPSLEAALTERLGETYRAAQDAVRGRPELRSSGGGAG